MNKLEEIFEFADRCPWLPKRSPQLISKFVEDLCSREEYLIKIEDPEGLVGMAILLDRISNPLNNCNLEILGIRDQSLCSTFLPAVFAKAVGLARPLKRSIEWGYSSHFYTLSEKIFSETGFHWSYDLFELSLDLAQGAETSEVKRSLPLFHPEELPEIYRTLRISFSQNFETSIPDYETWAPSILSDCTQRILVLKEEKTLAGFAHITTPPIKEAAEIRSLGVLPEYRNRKLGKRLLKEAVQYVRSLGYPEVHLSVAATNRSALSLYEREGFVIRDRLPHFRHDGLPSAEQR